MTENIISFMGVFLKHVIGVLLLSWRRMLRAGAIAFAIGVVLALLVAVIATGQAYPGALALVAALLFGAVLAYSVALTVLVEELILGVIDLIHLLEGDAKAVAHITEALTEREVGQVGQGLRRLIGFSVAASARPARPATSSAPPTLPTLPRYSAAPARPTGGGRAASATSATSATLEAVAMAGAAALAARAARPSAAPTPSPAADAAPAPSPADAAPAAPAAPKGEPVRADMLPRIGWTYEHEAIRPTRSVTPAVEERPITPATDAAEEPETLAALAGAGAVAGAGAAGVAASAASEAPAPEPTPEPMDIAVVSATALGADGPVAPTVMMEDAPPLEDERLAEPATLAVPDEESPAVAAESAPEADPTPEVTPEPALDPAMLTPAPSTTPLPQDEEPALDPAMLTPAPATTPLPPEEEPQPEEPVAEAHGSIEGATVVATLAPPPAGPAAAAEEPAVAEPAAAEEPIATADEPMAEEPAVAAEEPETAAAPVSEEPVSEEPVSEAPSPRSVFSRITRPVGGLEAAMDALGRSGVTSGPRASTPESGLWERLSQALIDRSGAPSSPFSAPQSPRANTPDVTPDTASGAPASEPDETPQG